MTKGSREAELSQQNTLNLQGYVPYFIRAIANKLAQAATRQYGERFGIGLNEWACLALLAREPEITAGRISEVGGYDKAVISRSISALVAKGYVSAEATTDHNRKRILRLTATGRKLHSKILALALARESKLLEGVSAADRKKLLATLRVLHANAQKLDQ